MRALQLAACGLGLLAWGLGHWLGVRAWPLEIAVRARLAVQERPAPACAPQTLTVRARAGARQLAVPLALAPGMTLVARVPTPLGTTQGLEAVALGDSVQFDRYGVLSREGPPLVAWIGAETPQVLMTALGGRFDHVGLVELAARDALCAAPAQ